MSRRGIVTRLRHPQTTVRWRLTLLYGGLFLVCGAALLAVTYALVANATTVPGPTQFVRAPGPDFLQAHGSSKSNLLRHVKIPAGTGPLVLRGPQAAVRIPPDIQKALFSHNGQVVVRGVIVGQRNTDLHHLEVESGIALAIMAIISALLGWLVAGRVLRPLRTITTTAQEISEASLHRRLALNGPRDELRTLADTIDGLLGRLEGAFDAQRRFVANASHELRTPLTAARAMLEMVLSDPRATVDMFRETCQQTLKENEYQEQLIDALLTLAQGQRGLDRREPIDLAALARAVIDARELDAAANGVRMIASVQPALITGDPRLVERLVSNLVENAIRHNAPDGLVEISVRVEANGTVLEVANTGPVVPASEVNRLLQPFQRLSRDRTVHGDGLGLGLSIVAAVAGAHDAQLDVQARAGGGLLVRVRFPLELVPPDLSQSAPGERGDEPQLAAALERRSPIGGAVM